jgi:hypothetical protein
VWQQKGLEFVRKLFALRHVCLLAFGDGDCQSRRHLIQGKCSEEESI